MIYYGREGTNMGDLHLLFLIYHKTGAVSAMQDAVTLANCIYELPENPTRAEIAKVFKDYQTERYPLAKNAYDTSHRLANVVGNVRERGGLNCFDWNECWNVCVCGGREEKKKKKSP
jgi:hypothetical protein